MTCRNALLACSAALVALALISAPAEPLRALIGSAFAAEPGESTTIPDDTYGEGGTRQSVSNDKHEVVGEVWRDKNGIVREQFEETGGGAQLWGFFNGDGTGQPSDWRRSLIAIRPMERPAGRWEMWVVGRGRHADQGMEHALAAPSSTPSSPSGAPSSASGSTPPAAASKAKPAARHAPSSLRDASLTLSLSQASSISPSPSCGSRADQQQRSCCRPERGAQRRKGGHSAPSACQNRLLSK